jgi:hypothetical protein
MVSSVSNAQQTPQAAQAAAPKHKQPQPATKPANNPQDTVHLSAAAQAASSKQQNAAHEATETAAQTEKGASSSDPQAQRLQARQAAVAKAYGGH